MAYNLQGELTLKDDFTATIRRAARSFADFRDDVRSSARDIYEASTASQSVASEISDAAGESRQLARQMENVSDSTEEAATAAAAFRALMSGGGGGMGDVSAINRTSEGLSRIVTLAPIVTAALAGVVAAAAPLGLAVGGLAASFGAAGIAATAFGAVAVSSLGKIFEAAEDVEKIQEKIDKATTAEQRLKAEQELAQLYEGMSTAQQGALKDLQGFQSFWGTFTQQFDEPVFKSFSQGLQATQKLLTAFTPVIDSMGNAVVRMMTNLNASMDGNGFREFITWMEQNGTRAFINFAEAGGNVLSGLFGVLKAFTPAGQAVETGLVNMTQRFKEWGLALENNQGFQNFVEYAKVNTPILMTSMRNIGLVIMDVIRALAPLGTTIMATVGSVAGFVHEHFGVIKTVVASVLAGFLAFRTVTTIISVVKGVATAFGTLTRVFNIAKNAVTLLRLSMLLFPGGWIVAAIGAVVAAGIYLYKNWDTVKAKASELVATIKDKWSNFKQNTADTFNSAKESIGNAMDSARAKVEAFFSPLLSFIDDAKDRFGGLVSAVKNFTLPSAVSTVIKGAGKIASAVRGGADGSHATGLASVPYNGYLAETHAGESILTANQSNTLRKMGVLQSNGSKPVLNTAPLTQTRYKVAKSSAASTGVTIEKMDITIQGAQKTTKEMARELVTQIKYTISNGGLAGV